MTVHSVVIERPRHLRRSSCPSDNRSAVDLGIWDAGFFTAVIRRADLAAHDFGNVYCRVESS